MKNDLEKKNFQRRLYQKQRLLAQIWGIYIIWDNVKPWRLQVSKAILLNHGYTQFNLLHLLQTLGGTTNGQSAALKYEKWTQFSITIGFTEAWATTTWQCLVEGKGREPQQFGGRWLLFDPVTLHHCCVGWKCNFTNILLKAIHRIFHTISQPFIT